MKRKKRKELPEINCLEDLLPLQRELNLLRSMHLDNLELTRRFRIPDRYLMIKRTRGK